MQKLITGKVTSARASSTTSRAVRLHSLAESSMFVQRLELRASSSWSSSSLSFFPSRVLGRFLFGASPQFLLLGVLGYKPTSLGLFPTRSAKEKDLLLQISLIQGKLGTRQTKGSQAVKRKSPRHVTRQTPSETAAKQDMKKQRSTDTLRTL